jgi:hypothetical protein
LYFIDEIGGVTSTNTVTITRDGADKINGANTLVVNSAYNTCALVTDGVSKWTATFNTVSQTITNGVTTKAPSENVVFDALALKVDTLTFPFLSNVFNPADSTTYYLGGLTNLPVPSTTATNQIFKTGFSGNIVGIFFEVHGNTVQGSTETLSIYIRNTTTATSSSSFGDITTDATSVTPKIFYLSGTTFAVGATDDITVEILTPAWVTNPTTTRWTGWVVFQK